MCDKLNNLCNINFVSQYAFIDGVQISVDNYILKNEKDNTNLKCIKGHELILANGKIIKPYFRHKNTDDVGGNPCTKWHTEWQGNFPIIEKEFPKNNNELQIKSRRADAYLEEHNSIIEFQHSCITLQEVNNRKNDYAIHNKNIIWIIHGEKSIKITKLSNLDRIIMEFIDSDWKYKSFKNYEYIYIDIEAKLYKLYPKDVKNNMIDIKIENIYEKELFIGLLKNNDSIIHNIDKPEQCTLYLKQQGAGNGKTYGIVQEIDSEEFEHYECLIFVSKQHSAKYVIYNELKNQIDNGQLKNIKLIENKEINKKYIIKIHNTKIDKQCQLIIGTIDSLMYTLGNKYTKDYDKFKGLVNSIIDGYIEDEKINNFNFGSINIKLNKKMCLIIDETQDLDINYGKALYELMRSRYIDSYIVGDKLQSLAYEENSFTYLYNNEFSYINKIIYEKTNICRRFYHPKLVEFVNYIIPFEKFDLPIITPYQNINDYENSLNIFKPKNKGINAETDFIMEQYIDAVNKYNYKSNDFLIITPYTNYNPLAISLESAINQYWIDKYKSDIFTRYAIFHKSEEGTSINLSESENSTRIVSIHTSKGDGRNAVFVIGLNEKKLIKFSKKTDNLLYNSLIHVTLTRAKQRLYIKIDDDNDDINNKILNFCEKNNIIINEDLKIPLKKSIQYKNIVDLLKNNVDYKEIDDKIINKTTNSEKLSESKNEKEIIDLGHHNIRYACMIITLYISIIANENNITSITKKQIFTIFSKLSQMEIHNCATLKEYNENLENNFNIDNEKLLSILKLSNRGNDYILYNKIIEEFMIFIKKKITKIINSNKVINLCPYECIILHYMIEITKEGKYSSITINELYNITNIYKKTFRDTMQGHDNCICKKHFVSNKNIDEKYINSFNYLLYHYEEIKKVNKIYKNFLDENKNISWLINHTLYYEGKNLDFKINKKMLMIGYSDTEVYNIYIKPQVNSLNYNEILLDSIFDTYLINYNDNTSDINNINNNEELKYNKKQEDSKKFGNKKVRTIIFTTDNDTYYSLDWINDNVNLINENKAFISNKLYEKILEYYSLNFKYIYKFYICYKNKYQSENPKKIINEVINEISKLNEQIPHFVIKFFECIENKLNFVKKSERKIELNKYDDNEYFICELNKIIEKSIKIFLNIPIIEEDDE